MTAQVVVTTELPHPPSAVWRALTEPAAMSEWLMPVEGFALMHRNGWRRMVHTRLPLLLSTRK